MSAARFLVVVLGFVACHAVAQESYRVTELKVEASAKPFLRRLAPANTGMYFSNYVSEAKQLENSLLADGAGVAAGDVDGDGWCDLYLSGAEHPNGLFRNLGGWRFTNVTASSGLESASQFSTGVALADIDGDGDLDLLVNSLGTGTQLFINDGKGHFQESTNCGLIRRFGSTSMALADIDGNGTLDLYVANYSTTKIEDRPNARIDTQTIDGRIVITAIDGVPTTSPDLTNRYVVDVDKVVRERGEPDVLYLNDGKGHFKSVSWTDGSFLDEHGKPWQLPDYDFGLSVMFRDMNGDLAPDIYVCNDLFPPDRIWLNDGRGKFRAMSNFAVRDTCRFSMGVDFADLDRDGYDEFFVVDMLSRSHLFRKVQTSGVFPVFLPIGEIDNRPQYKRNTLFWNRGDGTYAEIAQYAGLEATEWSWMPAFLDVDLDGFEDVLVTTGHMRDSLHADAVDQITRNRARKKLTDAEHRALKKKFYPVLKTPLQAFRNRHDLTFQDAANDWGFDYVGITQSMCFADLDNDGDLDVIVVPLNDNVLMFRNESDALRIAVRLKGKSPNTRGIGAQLRLFGGAVAVQHQELIAGGRYLSCDDAIRTFACGNSKSMRMEVTWRNGSVSIISNVQPNRLYEFDETSAARASPPAISQEPIFADVSDLLNHKHAETPFPDYDRQPLLSKKLSQLGPGITWADMNKDGWDDLIIGSGAGAQIAVYINDTHGRFNPMKGPPFDKPVPRDTTSLLPWPKPSGLSVLVGSSNYEDARPLGSCVREYNLAANSVEDRLPPWECSTGPLALADWNGDGVLDLFVGGRALPGKYPDEAFSLLFRGKGEQFELDDQSTKQISNAGLASGAVFSDLDADGSPELVIACDWGPVRVYRYNAGKWREVTADLGLDRFVGWWNSVTTGDFDNDGRLDIVAGNWGRNTKYQSFRSQPLRMAYGDLDGNGIVEPLETYFDPIVKNWMPWCSALVAMKAMPWLQERFKNHTAFGMASITDVVGDRAASAKVIEANWLETTVFLNRGTTFEARVLPREAQFSPVFGMSVADMDGDGNEDIFLAQNFFTVDGDTSRYDAGRGLWLTGDGKGNFRAVPGQESGIAAYGEQRGCAVSDFDGDGRVDLALTQNGAATKLYRNVKAKAGIRVRSAIGAVLRIDNGPAREVHGGSGYWSHDSAVQVMKSGAQLTVQWPGGKMTTTKIPEGAREISAAP
ncbi:MAG TPA: VCBS repeat-containing protein [Verrucomicrobiae bacterium]|nr:VCBS repeat-containing protein [Verrucomicrobiae bacterium]